MLRTPQETRNWFDEWSETYDAGVRTVGGPLEGYEASLAAAAAMVPVALGCRVLDVGIGTGAFGAMLAERGARVSGVDISPKMLERCAAAHPEFALSNGSFLPIPHPNDSFDAVVASFAVHEVLPDERLTACREIARVLKPGGHLCLLDIIFASAAARTDAQRAMGPLWDESEQYPLVWELDTALREAGFAAVLWQQTGPCHWALLGRLPREVR